MRIKKLPAKISGYLKEFGKLTPIALITTFLPIAGSAILLFFAQPLGCWLRNDWQTGAWVFLLGTILFCGLALLPTNVLGILSGWAFGFRLGWLLLLTGIVCAATLAFLINSRMAGDSLPQIFDRHPKGKAVYQALIGQGFLRTTLIIFLLRLSPAMPFALTNFLLSSARVPYTSFIIGTFLGIMPRSSAVVFIGSGLSELRFDDPQESWLLVFGSIATLISIGIISTVAKRSLERFVEEPPA